MDSNIQIKHGNVLEDVKTYQEHTFSTIISDPPYNLNSKWIICPETGKYIMKKSSDFMNKWEGLNHDDLDVMFKEFYRILKHGGFCVMFGIHRQAQPFYYYAMKNGFVQLEPMHWCSLGNFPKAVDVRLFLGKKTDDQELCQSFEGYKYSQAPLKKVFELIMIFVKPPKESILDDIIKGDPTTTPSCLNIDAGRIPMKESEKFSNVQGKRDTAAVLNDKQSGLNKEGLVIESHPLGRFPTNVLIDKGMEDYLGEDITKILHTCDDPEVFYEPVVSQVERNAGLDAFEDQKGGSLDGSLDGSLVGAFGNRKNGEPPIVKNPHVCLKPISLVYRIMSLFRLNPKYNQHVYIPFSGTCSEVIGVMKAGIPNITACEMNEEYIKIGKARLEHWKTAKIKEEVKQEEAEKKPKGKVLW